MRAIRWLAVAAVAAFAAYAAYFLAWQPFRCNRVKARVQRVALRDWNLPSGLYTAQQTRQRISDMQSCIAACPTDIDMYMTLAVNDRMIGRLEHAAAMYRQALKYDRRPELFLNLGIVQLEMNQRQEAISNLATAARFEIGYANDIPDPNLREEVLAAVDALKSGDTTARR